jgi:thiol-disulfide isomerase/thioredoxin
MRILSFLTFVFLGISYSVNAQKQIFVLNGKVIGRDTGQIILWFPDTSGQYVRDTGFLKNGYFNFSGLIKQPSYAHLIGLPRDGNYASFYLEPRFQTITVEQNNFAKVTMTGSKTQNQNVDLDNRVNKLDGVIDSLNKLYSAKDSILKNVSDPNLRNQIQDEQIVLNNKLRKITDSILDLRIRFIKQHPTSYVSATELYGLIVMGTVKINEAEALYNRLKPTIRYSTAGKLCKIDIDKRNVARHGTTLPEFTAVDLNDKTIASSQFKGKYLLIDFWASWCVPCRKEIPNLKRIYEKFHDKGFEILAISIDSKKELWSNAIKKDSTNYWHHILRNDKVEQVFSKIPTIPQQLLVDPSGKVVWSSFETNKTSWEVILENILK